MRCPLPNCKDAELVPGTSTQVLVIVGHRFTAELPSQDCPACGEKIIEGGDVEALRAGRRGRARPGRGFGRLEALKLQRKAMGLSREELAELLGERGSPPGASWIGRRPRRRGA